MHRRSRANLRGVETEHHVACWIASGELRSLTLTLEITEASPFQSTLAHDKSNWRNRGMQRACSPRSRDPADTLRRGPCSSRSHGSMCPKAVRGATDQVLRASHTPACMEDALQQPSRM
mmetsp:Transcript_43308/g.113959  ORF Transcript_43308/g.113959 Transcript_43308/m.113959 type:complete len:119 (+) Transcript_43308:187-543(+)